MSLIKVNEFFSLAAIICFKNNLEMNIIIYIYYLNIKISNQRSLNIINFLIMLTK